MKWDRCFRSYVWQPEDKLRRFGLGDYHNWPSFCSQGVEGASLNKKLFLEEKKWICVGAMCGNSNITWRSHAHMQAFPERLLLVSSWAGWPGARQRRRLIAHNPLLVTRSTRSSMIFVKVVPESNMRWSNITFLHNLLAPNVLLEDLSPMLTILSIPTHLYHCSRSLMD